MSDQVIVGDSNLNEMANDLRYAKERMEEYKTTMMGKLENLLGETWEGPSNVAYQNVKREWDQSVNEMNKIIHSLGATVEVIGGNYRHTERAVEGQW